MVRPAAVPSDAMPTPACTLPCLFAAAAYRPPDTRKPAMPPRSMKRTRAIDGDTSDAVTKPTTVPALRPSAATSVGARAPSLELGAKAPVPRPRTTALHSAVDPTHDARPGVMGKVVPTIPPPTAPAVVVPQRIERAASAEMLLFGSVA